MNEAWTYTHHLTNAQWLLVVFIVSLCWKLIRLKPWWHGKDPEVIERYRGVADDAWRQTPKWKGKG